MKIRIIYRNMQQSQALENHIHEELNKLKKIIKEDATPSSVDVTLAKEGHSEHLHQVEVHAQFPLGDFTLEEKNQDLYVAATHAIDALLRQVRAAKEKAISKRDRPDEHSENIRKDKSDFQR